MCHRLYCNAWDMPPGCYALREVIYNVKRKGRQERSMKMHLLCRNRKLRTNLYKELSIDNGSEQFQEKERLSDT